MTNRIVDNTPPNTVASGTVTAHVVALGQTRVRIDHEGPDPTELHQALLRARGIVEALCAARMSFTPLHQRHVTHALHEVVHLLQIATAHSGPLSAGRPPRAVDDLSDLL